MEGEWQRLNPELRNKQVQKVKISLICILFQVEPFFHLVWTSASETFRSTEPSSTNPFWTLSSGGEAAAARRSKSDGTPRVSSVPSQTSLRWNATSDERHSPESPSSTAALKHSVSSSTTLCIFNGEKCQWTICLLFQSGWKLTETST